MISKGGIYVITSPSGKQYVGSSANILARWQSHIYTLRAGIHGNKLLQRAWLKYGETLNFSAILVCEKQDLIFYEQRVMDMLQPDYNICKAAGSRRGIPNSPQVRAKISAGNKGKTISAAHIASARLKNTGKVRSAATRAKLSKARQNRITKPDTRLLLRAAWYRHQAFVQQKKFKNELDSWLENAYNKLAKRL